MLSWSDCRLLVTLNPATAIIHPRFPAGSRVEVGSSPKPYANEAPYVRRSYNRSEMSCICW